MCGVAKGRDEVASRRVLFTSSASSSSESTLRFSDIKRKLEGMRKIRNDGTHHERERKLYVRRNWVAITWAGLLLTNQYLWMSSYVKYYVPDRVSTKNFSLFLFLQPALFFVRHRVFLVSETEYWKPPKNGFLAKSPTGLSGGLNFFSPPDCPVD